jgi:hypothetical protein
MEIGSKVGRLTLIKELERLRLPCGQTNRVFLCKCDCGNLKQVRKVHLSQKRINSCGCIKKTKLGISSTKLYRVYKAINERCDGLTKDRSRYFERGIKVCELWKSNYLEFINWSLKNGYQEGLQIDRIDNNKGYSSENCRWTTALINVNNRENTYKVKYKGILYAYQDLVRKLKKEKYSNTIRRRIKRGWSVDLAFDTPIKIGNYTKKCNII